MQSCLTLCALFLLALPSALPGQISPGPLARAHHGLEGPSNCSQCHGLHREPMSQICLACHREIAWLMDQNRGYHARVVTTEKKECASCHPDHAGVDFQLIAWPGGSRDRFDHQLAGWTLTGKHAEAACEDCHTLKFRVGTAASLSKRQGSPGWVGLEAACASCHRSDDVHRGSLGEHCDRCHDATDWKQAPAFDHAASDFPLTGKHADVACDKCHLTPKLGIAPDARGRMIPRFKPVPFKECSNCHEDPHRGKLAGRCADCHSTRGWTVIDRTDFNHSATRYPLLGRHRSVSCEACHGTNLRVKDPVFTACASCHADPHGGQAALGGKPADCAACHRVDGFTPSTFTPAQHAATRFPLHGKHTAVPCAGCHKTVGKVVQLQPAFGRCADCHQDAHGGQLAARANSGSCDACHSDAGWKPSTFTVASHAALRLPLQGRHAEIACSACHAAVRPGLPPLAAPVTTLGTAKVLLAVSETACGDCHVDPHRGRYGTGGAFPVQGGCAACHDARSFRPSTVTVAMHDRFSFGLAGAHRAAPCVACHDEMRAPEAASTLIRSPRGVASLPFSRHRPTVCRSCHEADSPHGAQFAARPDSGACESCHTVAAFVPASRFDHERDATFPLRGAHANVPCASCHKAEPVPGGKPRVIYRPLSTACASCHGGTGRSIP